MHSYAHMYDTYTHRHTFICHMHIEHTQCQHTNNSHAHTHTHTHTHIHKHTHCVYMHTHTHTRARTSKRTRTHTRTHTHTHKAKQSVLLPFSGHVIWYSQNSRALSGPLSQCNATSWSRARNSPGGLTEPPQHVVWAPEVPPGPQLI